MTKSELRQLIKEELKNKLINEKIQKLHVKPNIKQLNRGDVNNGKRYAIVTRPQSNDSILVAAVYQNGDLVYENSFQYVNSKFQISSAVKQILRWIDKLGGNGKMAQISRDRRK